MPRHKPIPTHEEIQLAAYYLWEKMTTGGTEDNFVPSTEGPVYFWLMAEKELLDEDCDDAAEPAAENEI